MSASKGFVHHPSRGRSTTSVRVSASATYCTHPDALKRRLEAEADRHQRAAERAEAQMVAAAGLKWWEGALPPNMVVVGSSHQLQLLKETSRPILINWFTEDCYSCRTLHVKLKKIAAENPEILFLKLNGSSEGLKPLFEMFGITKVPYFHVVLDGRVLSEFSASLNPEKLALLRKELRAAVRARQEAGVPAVA
ncbi:Thioredoxin-like 2-1, chloroplastic [Tetrabaena socialis]|uniref:Thioredoxin-like 2-1, chloroplastic n=1 Tax=Tetrabaena socialis TaxID=47790 RepID=A0A2J8A0T4_9CHLO|nr:Thioredoxin-like 2-1, chloroplastic [Tetrabaena socialis]|eukprot:PNH06124.1 Thioredoxin-like 2-1, chloroplastic [Tetrabaena socialis]